MSGPSVAAPHRPIADNPSLLTANRSNHLLDNALHQIKSEDHNSIKCKNIIMNAINASDDNNNMNSSSSKNGNHCGLNISNMFAMPLNNVPPLYLFNPDQHPIRVSPGHTGAMPAHNPSAHLTHKTHLNNGLNSLREGSTPSPLSLSSISSNLNDSTANSFSLSKSSRTSDGLISGLMFNHNDVLREGGFMSYGSSPAENANSTPNSFTTSSLDGYLTGGQGGPASNHSFDLLDSDSFTEMPNNLSPSCQPTYEDNSGHSYVDKQKQVSVDRTSGAPIRKKRKNGPPVRPACPDCGKEFSNQSALSKHKLTHSDERKFVCNQCAKAFKRQDHLNGHLLTHRSKKPYECDVEGCEKTYCDARSLRRHKENHHPAGQPSGQNQSLQTLAFIPGIALNFSTANMGLTQSQSLNRIQYAPPPTSSVTTPLVPPVTVSAEQSAATQLQRLALHKHDNNIHNTPEKWVPVSREGPSPQKWPQNTSVINKNNTDNQMEKQSNKSDVYKLEPIANSNPSLMNDSSQENALLHQLLTQEQFKEKPHLYQLPQELSQQQQQSISQQPQPDDHQPPLPPLQSQHNHQSSQHSVHSESHQSIQNLPPLQSQAIPGATDNWPYDMFAQSNKSDAPQSVECPLCHRNFKNVPALNGHMRLHGGYLKNQTQNNNNNNNNNNITINNLTKKDVTKTENSQVHQNVKAILDIIKEKINRKQQSSLNNLGPPPQHHPHQPPQQHHHMSQVISGPQQVLAPMLSPVTPVTPTTTGNTSTFNYDFPQAVNNHMQYTHEDNVQNNDYYNSQDILLLKEQLQQSQQFRMPSQPSNIVNRFQAQERRQQQSRRHSDSSDLSVNSVENNAPKQTNNDSYQPMDSYSNQQFNDLLRRRTQRTCSDPGDQPLMTINTNYQSPQHQSHQYQQYYHQSHSVPTTPTMCHNNSALQPHSLPSTPTAAAAPVTFVHSPHQRGSVPNTPTDANQHFNFIPVPSPINQGSVHSQHSQHSQYSASPASVAQYSPSTPYSPTVPQFTYSVPQTQQTLSAAQQQNSQQNVYSEPQIYAAINDYTNNEQNLSDVQFNYNSNITENSNYFAPQNQMMSTSNEPNMQIDNQPIEQMSIQSLPQTSKQFFGNFSSPNTSQEYNSIANTSNYVQSSNYWTQSSLTNSVQMNQMEPQSQPSQVVSHPTINSTTTIVSHSSYPYSVPSAENASSFTSRSGNPVSINSYMSSSSDHHQMHVRSTSIHRRSTSSPPHLVVNLEKIDECDEETDDVFLSPIGVAPSPKRTSPAVPVISKRPKHRPEPLYIPPHVNTCGYQSRLRSPRLWDPSAVIDTKNLSPPPYTPPPMLSPVRSGPGLFWHIISGSMTPKSGTMAPKFVYTRKSSIEVKEKEEIPGYPSIAQTPTTAYEPFDCEIPETDIQPHVNIGPNFQARIPAFNKNKDEAKYRQEKADLVWDPSIAESLTDIDIESYLDLSCCACIPGSGRNKEYAMHLLNITKGDIHTAIVKLLEPHPTIAEGHPLANYHYAENDIWVPQEIESYQNALSKCDKDFFSISKEVGTKTVKQCIQFYYMWKKVCPDEYRRLRVIRRKREHETIFYNLRSKEAEENNNDNINNNNNVKLDLEMDNDAESELNGMANSCQSSDADDNMSSLLDSGNPSPATSVSSQAAVPVPEGLYPCKLCGKVFHKVKSRSAHMKIHGSGSAKY